MGDIKTLASEKVFGMFGILAALLASLVAVFGFYLSWKKQHGGVFYLSLVLLAGSVITWSVSEGWEFGVVYALCTPALLVWPFIGVNQVSLSAPASVPLPRAVAYSNRLMFQHLGHTAVVLLLLLVTSVLASLAICLHLPIAVDGQLGACTVLLPLLWGGLVYHYFAVNNKIKALISYIVVAGLSLVWLIFLPAF
ncbi:hypothetical protein [Aestuariibacter sp. A3R04]|uniref:hypothetical protein n=1 Tax=Aestuariibacter sp. A3R04 TaxID=2841571 RepID=UPI001C0A6367|nr:hypothetical protein [Aestuariibacter sp. A3R04]MBU3023161.1 hypothetical protein [Aestuariibacter sp. A3R04]